MAGEWYDQCAVGSDCFTPTQVLTGEVRPLSNLFLSVFRDVYRTITICTGRMRRIHNMYSWNHAIEQPLFGGYWMEQRGSQCVSGSQRDRIDCTAKVSDISLSEEQK